MENFSNLEEIGRVTGVGPGSVRILLSPDFASLVLNSMILVKTQDSLYIYLVSSLEATREGTLAEAEFFCEYKGGRVIFARTPAVYIGASVFQINDQVAHALASAFEEGAITKISCLQLADLGVDFEVTPERIFGKHFGVFGCTGSGKSWTVASIIESCQNYSCKIVLIDPSGEYRNFKKTVSIGFGEERTYRFSLPYWQLLETDLYTIFEPSDGLQLAKLKSAVKSLKLARLEPRLSVGGFVLKANREKKEFNKAYQRHYSEIENPTANFDITKLAVQVQNECVFPQQSPVEPNFWGGTNPQELASCASLIGRIESVLRDPDLDFIFNPDEKVPSLVDIIHAFVEENSKQILRLSLAQLTTAFGVREILVNIVGRILFSMAKQGAFMNRPLLFILDEAHQFASEWALKFVKTFGLSSLEDIAKQSRKFSLCLGIATQQPREISPLIVSQLGCCLVHRLNDPEDFKLIRPLLASNSEVSFEQLANLKTGQAYLAGVDFERSLRVTVKPPKAKPESRSADFQTGWKPIA